MADTFGGQLALLTIALRGGGKLALYAGHLVGRDEAIPLSALAWVGLAPDPTASLSHPWTSPPALAIRLLDGRQRIYAPADPPDAPRMMEAIVGQRPDMRLPYPPPPPGYIPPAWTPQYTPIPPVSPAPPLPGAAQEQAPPLASTLPEAPPAPPSAPPLLYAPPPPQGFPPFTAYGPPPPYGAPPVQAASGNDTVLAGLSHLSVFFAPVILPLIVWLTTRNTSAYASNQAKQAFVFHLVFAGIAFVAGIGGYALMLSSILATTPSDSTSVPIFPFMGFFFLWGGIGLVSLVNIIFSIVGAVHAFQGKPFHYPLLGKL